MPDRCLALPHKTGWYKNRLSVALREYCYGRTIRICGKILKVDLTSGQITEIPSSKYLPKYFGGRGLAAKLYWDEVTPEVGALDPENALIFTTGPLTATGAAMTSVGMCAGKAPTIYPSPTYLLQFSGGCLGT